VAVIKKRRCDGGKKTSVFFLGWVGEADRGKGFPGTDVWWMEGKGLIAMALKSRLERGGLMKQQSKSFGLLLYA
jgi:hypothetical protein